MTNLTNLPLSWIYSPSNKFIVDEVNLFRDESIWLSLVQSPKINFIDEIIDLYPDKKILLRGCDESISSELLKHGYNKINTGREAVLNFNTNHFSKKSLKELIRRGSRHGNVVEYNYSKNVEEKLSAFKNETLHAKKPQLKNLFRDKFLEEMRLFVFENHKKEWLGAVMVSKNSETKFHTELLLRKKSAPVGIMESLIFYTFQKLKSTGAKEFSLGEVPFITSTNKNIFNTKEFIINSIGKSLHLAYNYKGLYKFKNKFNPHWNDIYLCGKPNISFMDLVLLSQKTNFTRLILFKLFS